VSGRGYDANMRTDADITDLIQSSADALVCALRRAPSHGLDVHELTEVLSAVSRQRNRIDSAVSGVIGTLDRVVEQAADRGAGRDALGPFRAEILSSPDM
jgi:hypothetical protein